MADAHKERRALLNTGACAPMTMVIFSQIIEAKRALLTRYHYCMVGAWARAPPIFVAATQASDNASALVLSAADISTARAPISAPTPSPIEPRDRKEATPTPRQKCTAYDDRKRWRSARSPRAATLAPRRDIGHATSTWAVKCGKRLDDAMNIRLLGAHFCVKMTRYFHYG